MIFLADIAFALELTALVLGTALLIFVSKEQCSCKQFGKIVAYFTIVASILAMLCTSYYSIRYWEEGVFDSTRVMMEKQVGN
ncbi:MAG: hypothetical protein GTN99_10355 [Candidatus Dadabacteria bacterium]|nr:hypothetical protein [Candidatus Dadabacteria bacterium]